MDSSAARKDSARRFWKVAPAAGLGLLWTAAPMILGITLLAHIGVLSEWLQSAGRYGPLVYLTVFMLSSGLGFLPTYAQAILGGWVFGLLVGFPAALAGFAGGALIGYAIVWIVARRNVEDLIERNRKALAVRNALVGGGFLRTTGTVALLRLPPNSPFALTNLAMASACVAPGPYLLGTILGMAPRTAVAVGLAAAAAATGATDIQEFARERGVVLLLAGLATMIVVLAILGLIARRAIDRLGPQAAEPRDPLSEE